MPLKVIGRGNILVFPVIFLFFLAACARPPIDERIPPDFSAFHDHPLPPEVSGSLKEGVQSRLTPGIIAVAAKISGSNRRERLYKAVDYVWANFTYDNWLNDRAFARSAGELFDSRVLGGCSDFALAQTTLFRAVGVPARMVLTANTDWMDAFKKNDLLISTGHVFIEVYLEERWHLLDSTYRLLFEGYRAENKSFPRNEYLFSRALDYWSIGITDVAALDKAFQPMASGFDPALYRDPGYSERKVFARWTWK